MSAKDSSTVFLEKIDLAETFDDLRGIVEENGPIQGEKSYDTVTQIHEQIDAAEAIATGKGSSNPEDYGNRFAQAVIENHSLRPIPRTYGFRDKVAEIIETESDYSVTDDYQVVK